MNSVFVGVVGSEFGPALSHFGVEEADLPAVVVHGNADGNDKRKFKSDLQAFTAEAVAKFLKDAADGKVAEWVKSEAAPTSNDGPVTIVTGKTVKEIVLDETKDVIVEVQALQFLP